MSRSRRTAVPRDAVLERLEARTADPFSLRTTPCRSEGHTKAKTCIQNPNCLYGLGEHRAGLWLKKWTWLVDLGWGRDPSGTLRAIEEVPCGLTNLGATCYVNCLIQLLFYILPLRTAVFQWTEADGASHSQLMKDLQVVFAHLQERVQRSYNPVEFVRLLQLSTSEQQDVHEFSKLLMQALERAFGGAANESLHQTVPALFKGTMAYVTTCMKCNKESRRPSDFYELEAHVSGHSTLEESLQSIGHAELLEGPNQYFCANCQCKCDATRQLQISHLPQVLNVQLVRLAYDPASGGRKKLKDIVKVPSVLDVSAVFPSCSPLPAGESYILSAVVYHKGADAHTGHYVADVWDPTRCQWWTIDDEIVTKTKAPVEPTVDKPGAKKKRTGAGAGQSTAKRPRKGTASQSSAECKPEVKCSESEVEVIEDSQPPAKPVDGTPSTTPAASGPPGLPSSRVHPWLAHTGSRDSYMLVYTRGRLDDTAVTACARPTMPADLLQHVQDANQRLRAKADDFQAVLSHRKQLVEQRKSMYTALFDRLDDNAPIASVANSVSDWYWVPTNWLSQWVTGDVNGNTVLTPAPGRPKANASIKAPAVVDVDLTSEPIEQAPSAGPAQPVDVVSEQSDVEMVAPSAASSEGDGIGDAVVDADADADADVEADVDVEADAFAGGAGDDEVVVVPPEPTGPVRSVKELMAEGLSGATMTISPLCCPHGKLSPSSVSKFKRLSAAAYDRIVSDDQVKVDMVLRGAEAQCDQCTVTFVERVNQLKDKYTAVSSLAPAIRPSLDASESAYFLSRAWVNELRAWLPKAGDLIPDANSTTTKTLADMFNTKVNEDITCPHHKLFPSRKYNRISEALWTQIKSLFPNSIEYSVSEEPCAICDEQSQAVAIETKKASAERAVELGPLCLRKLKASVDGYPSSSIPVGSCPLGVGRYSLLDHSWLQRWREYVAGDGTRPDPEQAVKYTCDHDRGRVPPALRAWLDSGGAQPYPLVSGDVAASLAMCEIVPHVAMEALLQLYPTLPDMTMQVSADGSVAFQPELCEVCQAELTSMDVAKRTSFVDERIIITLLKPGQSESSRRRSRRNVAKNVAQVVTSSSDKVLVVKFKILETGLVDCAPAAMQLTFQEKPLTSDQTLGDAGVLAGCTLHLQVLDDADPADLVDSSDISALAGSLSSSSTKERGFAGTSLFSSSISRTAVEHPWSCSACTFLNKGGTSCQVCFEPREQQSMPSAAVGAK